MHTRATSRSRAFFRAVSRQRRVGLDAPSCGPTPALLASPGGSPEETSDALRSVIGPDGVTLLGLTVAEPDASSRSSPVATPAGSRCPSKPRGGREP